MGDLDLENRALREKLDMTNGQVGSFIRDMGSLLDQHELHNGKTCFVLNFLVFNMEVESDEEEDLHRVVDVEYDENRPHAGTGGSSKMKSRPGQ